MEKVFRVTVIEKRGFKVDVEARDWADSIRIVREALNENGIKRPDEADCVFDKCEVSGSGEIRREDAIIQQL